MINRRQKTLIACLSLAVVCVSIWIAHVCICIGVDLPAAVRQTAMKGLVGCSILGMICFCLLIFSLVLCFACHRDSGLHLLDFSLFALLLVNGQFVGLAHVASPLPNLTLDVVGLYCFILTPVPVVVLLYHKVERYKRPPFWVWLPACLSALLPVILWRDFARLSWVFYEVALVALLFTLVYAICKCVQGRKPGVTMRLMGLIIGMSALMLSLAATGVGYLIWGTAGSLSRYGLGVLLVGVSFDVLRPILSLENRIRSFDELRAREEEYRFASRHMSMYIIRYEVATKHAQFRTDTAITFGLPQELDNVPESLVEQGKVVENSIPNLRELYANIAAGVPKGSGIFGIYNKSGQPIWLHTDYTTNFDEYGLPEESIISSYEIVGMREKEAAYQHWLKTYQELCAKERCVYFEIDLTRDEIRSRQGELLPQLPDEVQGSMGSLIAYISENFIEEADRPALLNLFNRVRLLGCYEQDIRRETLDCHRRMDGESLWTQASVRMISDPYSSDVLGFVLLSDIEEQKRKEARDRVRSLTDELTGLLSRVSFVEQFDELRLATGTDSNHAILMIDLDGFKAVNDTFGHRFGDKVLIDVANDLRAINRSDDLIARLGGDEYILCLKNIPADTGFLEARCRAIGRALSKQYGDDVAISGSVGVAIFPKDGATFDELYQHADQAQYIAKQRGRNRFLFYSKEQQVQGESGDSDKHAPAEQVGVKEPEMPKEASEHRHTILVVDDQRINRALLREIFKENYEVLEAKGAANDIRHGA